MYSPRKRIILLACALAVLLALSANSWGVSLSPEVVEKLRREGRLQQTVQKALDARARGVWAPNPNPPVRLAPLGKAQQDTLKPFVLCIDFSDNPATKDTSEFSFLLFSQDFALPTGSFRDYYLENSYYQIIDYYRRKKKLPHFVTHQFRKLFKTEASIPERGIDRNIVEFFMGHVSGLANVGGVYDRTPEIHEDVIEREYAKLEPYINIYSGTPYVQEQEQAKEIKRLKDAIGEMKENARKTDEILAEILVDLRRMGPSKERRRELQREIEEGKRRQKEIEEELRQLRARAIN